MDAKRYRLAEKELFADAAIEPAEHTVMLRSLRVTARVLEVGQGDPAVFLHGGPMAAGTWAYVAAAISGVRCLLVERPGTGLTDPLPTTLDADELPRFVVQLTADVLDGLGLERASLVGSSLGGYSALLSAASLPDRVNRVVLLGCPAFVPGWTEPAFFKLLRTPLVGRAMLAVPATAASARLSLRQMGHRKSLAAGRIPPAMLGWTAAWQRHTDTMKNDAAMIVRCGSRRGGFDVRLGLDAADLAAVTAPCLVIVGTDDPVGSEEVGRDLLSLLPHAKLDLWPNAGHLPWLDEPARAAATVSAFVTDTGALA